MRAGAGKAGAIAPDASARAGSGKAGAWASSPKPPQRKRRDGGSHEPHSKWAGRAELAEANRSWGVKPRAPRAKRGTRLQILLKQNDIGRQVGCGAGYPALRGGRQPGGADNEVGGGSADPPLNHPVSDVQERKGGWSDLWPTACAAGRTPPTDDSKASRASVILRTHIAHRYCAQKTDSVCSIHAQSSHHLPRSALHGLWTLWRWASGWGYGGCGPHAEPGRSHASRPSTRPTVADQPRRPIAP